MWLEPPTDLTLHPAGAHVWRAPLDLPPAEHHRLWETLSADERQRADRFRFDKDRHHFIAGRGILRILLAKYLQMEPAQIVFRYGNKGKPMLPERFSLEFNISHSGGLALFGFVQGLEIGVDLEQIRPGIELERLARQFFSENETRRLLALPHRLRPEAFFNCWSRKEAFIKAEGSGLAFPLDQFEVSFEPGEAVALLATHFNPQERNNWSLFNLLPGSGYTGALAVKGSITTIDCWQFNFVHKS